MFQLAPLRLDSPVKWLRGPAKHDQGWIVLDLDRAREYTPAEEPGFDDLLVEFAIIRSPHDALAFVRRFGLPNYPAQESGKQPRIWLRDWQVDSALLSNALSLAATYRDALVGDPEALELLHGKYQHQVRQLWSEATRADIPLAQTNEEILQVAYWGIEKFVNAGLSGNPEEELGPVSERIRGTDWRTGVFSLGARADHLRLYAYHQLAMLLVNKVPISACVECGKYFQPKKRRHQQYCSDLCANRARWRRYSEKREGSAAGA